jgi:hypothetical protein
MDFNSIASIIGTLGFPIVACLVLGWFINKIYKKSEEREALLMNEIKECRAINGKAVETLAVYAERLGIVEQDVREIKEILISNE